MKSGNILLALLFLLSVQVSAQSKKKASKSKKAQTAVAQSKAVVMPNGVSYEIFTPNASEKIKMNDVITFNFIQKTDKDSVLFNSFEAGRPVTIAVDSSRNIADLMYFFPLMGEKDSALVKIPADSLFKDGQMERPSFFPAGSSLQFVIRVDKVQSMEQAMSERQKMMDAQAKTADSLKVNEVSILEAFVSKNQLKMMSTPSGLRYTVLRPTTKVRPVAGDTVYVNYIGRTLSGKLFDSSIEAEAKKGGLEQPGRNYEPISFVVGEGEVIPGWDEGLLLLNEGSKARFLIPSSLAYGPRGAGQDIAPFSTLDFEVELVKVVPVKKTVQAPKKAPAVRKPSAPKLKAPIKSTPAKKTTTATKKK
ncbi:MAG: FKBP-type peptidyl-prolyl cis-trans isomerase [Arcticibacter sp.]